MVAPFLVRPNPKKALKTSLLALASGLAGISCVLGYFLLQGAVEIVSGLMILTVLLAAAALSVSVVRLPSPAQQAQEPPNIYLRVESPKEAQGSKGLLSDQPDVRFRLNQNPDPDQGGFVTYVELENKTGLELGAWVDLRPAVAGSRLGTKFTNGHYNGQRMWLLKKWGTWSGTRFRVVDLVESAGLNMDKIRELCGSSDTRTRNGAVAIGVQVRYRRLHVEGRKIKSIDRPAIENLPEYYHFDILRGLWVADVAVPWLYEEDLVL